MLHSEHTVCLLMTGQVMMPVRNYFTLARTSLSTVSMSKWSPASERCLYIKGSGIVGVYGGICLDVYHIQSLVPLTPLGRFMSLRKEASMCS